MIDEHLPIFRMPSGGAEVWKVLVNHLDAAEILNAACVKHRVDLPALVAETALWAHPEAHFRYVRDDGSAAVYPGIRRVRPGETRGATDSGRLDDNTYANRLLKRALGLDPAETVGFECSHVWPNSCYDPRYHTVIANLVLVPAPLAGLTDHSIQVQAALQYRAFELYRWHPAEQPAPIRPESYPENWRAPQADPKTMIRAPYNPSRDPEAPVGIEKLRLWAGKPTLNVHRIIALMCESGPMSRDRLVTKIEALRISQNPYGTVASLMTNSGNSYGRVFVERAGDVRFHPAIEATALRLWDRRRPGF